MKDIKVVFSSEATQVYTYLNQHAPTSKNERMLLNAIDKKIEIIKSNIHYGDPIAKRLIPEEYKTKYGVTNLFRVELPNYWRMLYTLTDGESTLEIIAFVIDIVSHKDYDKLLGYRRYKKK